jgi:5-dehydro-4-deoxyglucarate dehydratase
MLDLDGLLFFPVTAFAPDGSANPDAFRRHIRSRLEVGPGAVFACCGTGEFWSLGLAEYEVYVRIAVEETAGRVPVIAGTGYGLALATEFAAAARRAGADGLLAMPPYLVVGGQAGLRDHYLRLADAADLDIIVYQRDNVVFTPETVVALAEHPRIVGFKDGVGDLDLMRRIVGAVRTRWGAGRLMYFNGMPTAEMTQQAYEGIGVPMYSSAVFCFAPDLAMGFYEAYASGDTETVDRLIDAFWIPYVQLRQSGAGYAVSLVKAGVRLDGLDVGPVRAPLSEPADEHVRALATLLAAGREVLAA